ncbi:hypothetical protein FRC17_004819 [Serendipita sp. 399]|nr:hypothetical protein FRC17_004819 [Serendipita sp. 399]
MDIVCNTVLIKTIYSLRNLKDFGYGVNQRDMYDTNSGVVSQQQVWTTVMGTVIGAYSINKYSSMVDSPKIYVDAVSASVFLVPTYATYILIVNTVVLVVLLLALWRLLNASPLHRDFMDPTRLLLGPLADVQLFNASLDETIRKLDNPHLQVTSSQQLLLTGSKDGDNPPPLSVQ